MIKEGILGKFGKPTEQTPKNWREMLYDVSASSPVTKVNFNHSNEFVPISYWPFFFQRSLEESSTMGDTKPEKTKKDKKQKVEDDDDQMQTSSVADESAHAVSEFL